jgi:hypothetical protein
MTYAFQAEGLVKRFGSTTALDGIDLAARQCSILVNPLTEVMAAARGLMADGPVAGPVIHTLLWSVGLLAVFFPIAVRAYRRRT